MRNTKLLKLVLFVSLVVLTTQLPSQRDKKPSTLFSWAIEKDSLDIVTSNQEPLSIQRLFQYVHPNEYADGTLSTFIQEMDKKELRVYALDGGYYWGTTDYGYDEMIDFIDQVVLYNSRHLADAQLQGIVLDVEPAQDENWRHDQEGLMRQFVFNMTRAYDYANSKGLYVVVCITYWYDDLHLEHLTEIIRNACDEVAIMNYDRGNELANIQTEVALAKEFDKPVITIFEFEKPDNRNVHEQNSYFYQGPLAALEAFINLDLYYDYPALTAGWHQLKELHDKKGTDQ
ncbi:hypothetical protein LG275_13050 [Chryseomicrobium palamuruense]